MVLSMKPSDAITENTFPFKNLPVEIQQLIAVMVLFNNTKDAKNFQLVSKAWYHLLDAHIWKAYFFQLFPHIKLIKTPSKEEANSQSFWKGLIKEAKGVYVKTINSINNALIKQLFEEIYQNNPQNLTNAHNAISGSISNLTYFFTDKKTTTHLQLPEFSPASFAGSLNRGLSLKQMYDYVLSKENQNENTLFWAAAFNQVDVIDALTLTDWNTPVIYGRTPFFIACQHNHLKAVEALIKKPGIKPNQALTTYGATPLHITCYNGHLEIVAQLLKHPDIQVNQACTDNGATPLHIACQNGHLEIVERLLQRPDIQVNQACTSDGATPLYIACKNGHFNIALALLLKGADLNIRTRYGITPLDYAERYGHHATVKLLNLFSKLFNSHPHENKETLLLHAFKDYVASYRRQWFVRPLLRFFGDSGKHHGDSIQEALNSAKLNNQDNTNFTAFIDALNQKNINAKETGELYMLLKIANHYLDTKEQPSASIDENTPLITQALLS